MSSASQPPLDTVANALRGLQLHNSQLENENRQLSRHNVELEAEKRELAKQVKQARKKSSGKGGKSAKSAKSAKATTSRAHDQDDSDSNSNDGGEEEGEEPSGNEMNAFQCGKLFVCAAEIWVQPSPLVLFQSPLSKPTMAHDDPDRYKIVTPELVIMGTRADLYHLVPERLHESMGSVILFQSEFQHGMKNGRSTFINTLRGQMPTFLKLDASYFATSNTKLRQTPEVQRYLKFDLDDPLYPDLPPILFPGLVRDLKELFRNDILIKGLGVILRGNGFLTSYKGGTRETNYKLWRVSNVTGPMIACVATMIVHLLSPASTFSEDNEVINLFRTHQLFKELLIGGRDNPNVKETLRIWQDEIFGDTVKASEHIASVPERESASSTAKSLLRDLWAETGVDPSAAAAPARRTAAGIPSEIISIEESSSSEGSRSGSSNDSGKSSSGSESEDAEEEGFVLDEDVGASTDYDDVYVNPVPAPTSARSRSSRHAPSPVEMAHPPSSIAHPPFPAHHRVPVAPPPVTAHHCVPVAPPPVTAHHSVPVPAHRVPTAPGPASSHRLASLPGPSNVFPSALVLDAGLAVAPGIAPSMPSIVDGEVVASETLIEGKSKSRPKPKPKKKKMDTATDVPDAGSPPVLVADPAVDVVGQSDAQGPKLRTRRPRPSPAAGTEPAARSEDNGRKTKSKESSATKAAAKTKKANKS